MQEISVSTLCAFAHILNLIVFIIGAALAGSGAYMFMVTSEMGAIVNDELAPIMIVLCVVGGALILTVIMGTCGVCKHKSMLLDGFIAGMILILLAQFAAVVIIFTFEASVHYFLSDGFGHSMLFYGKQGDNIKFTEAIDYIQENKKCCGQYGYMDFGTHNATYWISIKEGDLPDSCCKNVSKECGAKMVNPHNPPTKLAYTEGCYEKTKDFLKTSLTVIGCAALVFMFIQMGSIFLNISLQRKFKEHEDYQIQGKKVKIVKQQDKEYADQKRAAEEAAKQDPHGINTDV